MTNFENGLVLKIGNMFGGKTIDAILDCQRAAFAGKKVQAFKISWDNRNESGVIKANNGQLSYPAETVPNTCELSKKILSDSDILLIDELQFFDEGIIEVIEKNSNKKRIIGTAIQRDFRGNVFPLRVYNYKEKDSNKTIAEIMSMSNEITQHWPLCYLCGKKAPYIQRVNENGSLSRYEDPTIKVGGKNDYFASCPKHFVKPIKGGNFLLFDGEVIHPVGLIKIENYPVSADLSNGVNVSNSLERKINNPSNDFPDFDGEVGDRGVSNLSSSNTIQSSSIQSNLVQSKPYIRDLKREAFTNAKGDYILDLKEYLVTKFAD